MTVMVSSPHSSHHGHAHPQHYSSYSPSDFDLLKALTSSSGLSQLSNAVPQVRPGGARKTLSSNTRRPQMDPLILETAAMSGPHVTRNHFLHEFYPHPEDPSSSFSHHQPLAYKRPRGAYASCDIGPEEDLQLQQRQSQQTSSSPSPSTAAPSTGHHHHSHHPTAFPIAVEAYQQGTTASPSSSSTIASKYQSRQAPRRVRLEREKAEEEEQQLQRKAQEQEQEQEQQQQHQQQDPSQSHNDTSALSTSPELGLHPNLKDVNGKAKLQESVPAKSRRRSSIIHPDPIELPKILKQARSPVLKPTPAATSSTVSNLTNSTFASSAKPPLQVLCHGRTRVPTPHGEVFIHLYKNNHDDKEHLAFVFDREQLAQPNRLPPSADNDEEEDIVRGTLRSKSLDAAWREGETEMERIVRGAYVGRLSSSSAIPSSPPKDSTKNGAVASGTAIEPVLIRVHSECFTGETIGSQRCDCGEQLDEAFRLIATSPSGLGIIVYLRQEGRGIGLLEKIKAYNLQDLGHDTVTANLLLGHSADMRTYGIAGEILRDLGVDRVKLLTNNPDKIDSVEKEGIKVVERVPMVPRGWTVPTLPGTRRKHHKKSSREAATSSSSKSQRSSTKKRRDKSTLAGRLGHHLEGISSIAQSSASEYEEGEGEADSYEFPSVDGSEAENVTTEARQDHDGSESEDTSDDDDDDATDTSSGDAAADYLIAMNRTGVGMIGAGTTHSVELERYLKTKIERMGHMLAVPNTPPSTPEPLRRSKKKKNTNNINKKDRAGSSTGDGGSKPSSQQSGTGEATRKPPPFLKDRKKVGKSRLEDSMISVIQTDPESINCEDCSECGGNEDHGSASGHEDMASNDGHAGQPVQEM